MSAYEPVQYLSISTIARLLDRSESYVRKAMNARDLRYEVIGGERRVTRAAYEAWLDTLRQPKR